MGVLTNVQADDRVERTPVSESLAKVLVLRSDIFAFGDFGISHASTIAELSNGSLIAAWFGDPNGVEQDNAVWASTYIQGSKKWSKPRKIGDCDFPEGHCWNPVFYVDKKGVLYLFFKQGLNIPGWQGVVQRSFDNGKTWKDRIVLPQNFLGPIKNKPLLLKDGTLLCPSSTETDGWRVHFELTSDVMDFGRWIRTEDLSSEEDRGIQPTLLTYSDGRIQALCRNFNGGDGHVLTTWSVDQGKTWSKLERTCLPNPCCGVDGVTLADGRQLLVYNHSNQATGNRGFLNVSISDDGVVWKAVCVLEDGGNDKEFSYPAVIQTRDGLVHILYSCEWKMIRHVVLDPKKMTDDYPTIDGSLWESWPKTVK